ncbi:hypothetical protein IJ182_02760 [bacterium]|nr:hypothetical protein [bacterium]
MISSKDIKIKITDNLSSEYIETELKKLGYDILRWAITDYDKNNYTVNIAYVEN